MDKNGKLGVQILEKSSFFNVLIKQIFKILKILGSKLKITRLNHSTAGIDK